MYEYLFHSICHRGQDVSGLLSLNNGAHYDLVILSEVLWRDTYPLHAPLAHSVASLVREGGYALLSLVHRPCLNHSPDNDLEFIQRLRDVNIFIEMQHSVFGTEVGDEETIEVSLYLLQHRSS